MRSSFILVFLLCCFTGYSQTNFEWLLGKWKIENKNVYEVWAKTSEAFQLSGSSYKVNNGADTVMLEKITFTKIDNDFFYIPYVQENKGPVKFRLTSYDDKSFTAENPEHDFPKVIRYTIVRKDEREKLLATIEGNGKVISYTFDKIE